MCLIVVNFILGVYHAISSASVEDILVKYQWPPFHAHILLVGKYVMLLGRPRLRKKFVSNDSQVAFPE